MKDRIPLLDHLKISTNLDLNEIIKKKKNRIIYTDNVKIKIVSLKDVTEHIKTLYQDRSLIITEKYIFIFKKVTRKFDIKRIDRKAYYKIIFDEINDLTTVYRPEFSGYVLNITGGLRILIRSHPKRVQEQLNYISKAYKNFLGIEINRSRKPFDKIDEFDKVGNDTFCFKDYQNWSRMNIIMEGEVLCQKAEQQTIYSYGWNFRYAVLTTTMLIIFDSKEIVEAMKFFFSHEKDQVSGEFPPVFRPLYLPKMKMTELKYNAYSNDNDENNDIKNDEKQPQKAYGLTLNYIKAIKTTDGEMALQSSHLDKMRNSKTNYFFKFGSEVEKNAWKNALKDRHKLNRSLRLEDPNENTDFEGGKYSGSEEDVNSLDEILTMEKTQKIISLTSC